MMTSLRTPYRDTVAEELSWGFGLAPMRALASLDLLLDGADIELRILGSSHQVVMASPAGRCSETVACIPGRVAGLPPTAARKVGAWDYTFSAWASRRPEPEFRARVERLVAEVDGSPRGIVGTFPGSDYAVTALLVENPPAPHTARPAPGIRRPAPGRRPIQVVCWSTWHSYPQQCELVVTRTRLARRPTHPDD